jgi:glycosyltransferase involved in cell wall biosynthesis
MHVVALNQFYAPDGSATAQLLTELAEGLVRRGHRVTVVTSGPRFSRTFQGARGARLSETMNGVGLVRLPSTHLGKSNLLRRGADYLSFYLAALDTLLGLPERPDVLMPLTTPPFVALAAQLAALPMRVPLVALVQDLYPDVAVRLGVLRHGGLPHRSLATVAGLSLRHATRVVALSELMAEHLRRYGVRPERIDVIPNWALAELDRPAPTGGAEARLEYGLGDRFVVMYSGNLGAGHQFETLLAAARRLRDRRDIVFAFVGEGVRKPEVVRFVARERLTNVRVFGLAPRARLAESLAAADLHVITMRDGMEGLVVPSKLYGILAAERPALFIGPARDSVARTLDEAGAGRCFDNGDVSGVVGAILDLSAHREAGRAMGVRGRTYLGAALGRERALTAYERVLLAACQRSAGAGGVADARPDRRLGP